MGDSWISDGGLLAGMPTMTGKQIFENFQQGTGSSGLQDTSVNVAALHADYKVLQSAIEDLMKQMKSHWQGEAGGAARHGAGPIAVEFALASPKLKTTQDLVGRQAQLFDRTKSNVVPVPDKPEAPSGWGSMLAEGASVVFLGHDTDEVNDYESQLSAHNDAAQHNVEQMRKYSDGSDYNTTNLPTDFGKMIGSDGEIRIDHSGGGDSTGTHNGTGNTPGSTMGGYQGYTPGGYDNGGTQPGSSIPSTSGNLQGPPQSGGSPVQNTSTTGTSSALGTAPPGYGSGQQPGGDWGQSLTPRGPGGPSGPGGGLHSGMYGGGGGFGGTGSGGGYGKPGTRGPGGSGGAADEPGSGSRSGVGRGRSTTGGPAAAEEASGRAGSGRGGRMMPRSGGKSNGAEDLEHETPDYLLEPEPDKFWFGDQPKVAPPCIGELPN